MEVSMFSTDWAVSDVQSSHVLLKTPLEIVDGFQFANTSAEKSVSDEQYCHAWVKNLPTGSSVEKEVKSVLYHGANKEVATGKLLILNDARSVEYQAKLQFSTLGSSVDQLVSPELLNALLKFVVGKVSRLKSVSAEHERHAPSQLPAVGNGVLNEVSPLSRHAL